jgi:hypothetical protein
VLTPGLGEAAFAGVRDHLAAGRLPPREAVRPAEFINAFRHRHPPPAAGGEQLAAALELGDAPWAPERRLVRIGLQGRDALLAEARQGLVDGLAPNRAAVARDVRIQVEFNPAMVAGYRLIGREHEASARTTPIDELATAPELGASQAFTALYEIVPAAPSVVDARAGDLLTVRLQFAAPAGGARRTLEFNLASRSGGVGAGPQRGLPARRRRRRICAGAAAGPDPRCRRGPAADRGARRRGRARCFGRGRQSRRGAGAARAPRPGAAGVGAGEEIPDQKPPGTAVGLSHDRKAGVKST